MKRAGIRVRVLNWSISSWYRMVWELRMSNLRLIPTDLGTFKKYEIILHKIQAEGADGLMI